MKILYGKDSQERIVGVHPHDDKMRVYTRNEDDEVTYKDHKFNPFVWTTEKGAEICEYQFNSVTSIAKAKGGLKYDHIVAFDDVGIRSDVVYKTFKKEEVDYYNPGNVVTQFLMASGKTFFKGMTPEDIHRMQFDIETIAPDHEFPNAEREQDEIVIISISDNRGHEYVLHTSDTFTTDDPRYVHCDSEYWLLVEFIRKVHALDPDVLEGHNVFDFDLSYIYTRCKMHELEFGIGRNGKPPRVYQSKKSFAERDFEYQHFLIAGRSVIDTMFLAVDYDVFARDLPSLRLKDLAKYFDVVPDGRTYVEGDSITDLWFNDPERLLAYALDDVRETRGIAEQLHSATFFLSSMLPMTYQDVLTKGSAGSIETLFVREYLNQRTALPEPKAQRPYAGGYTDIFKRGVYKDLCYADVASLYPSIMQNYGVQPENDILGLFGDLLTLLTDQRFEWKRNRNDYDKGSKEYQKYDALQNAAKVIINSFYGMLGHAFSVFNDFDEADRVTEIGRGLLKRMFEIIVDEGGDPVLCDTDGILTMEPRKGMTDEEVDEWIQRISERMPNGINIDNDGRFERAFSYKKKNYVLKPRGGGDIKMKGSSLKSRMLEPFGQRYIKDVAIAILEEDLKEAKSIHERQKRAIIERTWSPDEFCKSATLKDSLDQYEKKLKENPNKYPQAQYELALQMREKGRRLQPGDRVTYYVTGHKKGITVYLNSELKENWKQGSENSMFYLDRLKTFAKRFEDFFSEEDFHAIFNMRTDAAQSSLFGEEELDAEIINTTVKENP